MKKTGANYTDGLPRYESYTMEYRSWCCMRARCLNETNPEFKNYGARGIVVCERWRDSYKAFLDDMGRKPSISHTLERRDNSGGYSPENCLWATKKAQARNRRTNQTITHNGQTRTIAEWAERTGMPYARIYGRWLRGLSPETILKKGDARRPASLTLHGETKTLREWAVLLGIRAVTLHWRKSQGWSDEKALTTPARPPKSP